MSLGAKEFKTLPGEELFAQLESFSCCYRYLHLLCEIVTSEVAEKKIEKCCIFFYPF